MYAGKKKYDEKIFDEIKEHSWEILLNSNQNWIAIVSTDNHLRKQPADKRCEVFQ